MSAIFSVQITRVFIYPDPNFLVPSLLCFLNPESLLYVKDMPYVDYTHA